jgi:hypothetical protein
MDFYNPLLSIAQIFCFVVATSNVFEDAQKSVSPIQSSSVPQELNLLDYVLVVSKLGCGNYVVSVNYVCTLSDELTTDSISRANGPSRLIVIANFDSFAICCGILGTKQSELGCVYFYIFRRRKT